MSSQSVAPRPYGPSQVRDLSGDSGQVAVTPQEPRTPVTRQQPTCPGCVLANQPVTGTRPILSRHSLSVLQTKHADSRSDVRSSLSETTIGSSRGSTPPAVFTGLGLRPAYLTPKTERLDTAAVKKYCGTKTHTTMALDGFTGDDSDTSGGPTKTTYYQFENPEHPDSKEFEDPETAKRHFDAARYVQQALGTDRHNLVGEFLVSVQILEEDGDPEELQSLVQRLTE